MTDETNNKYRNGHGYIRWSSDKEGNGDSQERQTNNIEHIAKDVLKIPLIKTYIDGGEVLQQVRILRPTGRR